MNINVPIWAREHFWEEPPPGCCEFWAFRWCPPCREGEELVFRFDGVPVARAICGYIEQPGASACLQTGRFKSGWKVFWRPETFVDLRVPMPEALQMRNEVF